MTPLQCAISFSSRRWIDTLTRREERWFSRHCTLIRTTKGQNSMRSKWTKLYLWRTIVDVDTKYAFRTEEHTSDFPKSLGCDTSDCQMPLISVLCWGHHHLFIYARRPHPVFRKCPESSTRNLDDASVWDVSPCLGCHPLSRARNQPEEDICSNQDEWFRSDCEKFNDNDWVKIGLCNFYRRFMPYLVREAAP